MYESPFFSQDSMDVDRGFGNARSGSIDRMCRRWQSRYFYAECTGSADSIERNDRGPHHLGDIAGE
jgi:hypothetical protein